MSLLFGENLRGGEAIKKVEWDVLAVAMFVRQIEYDVVAWWQVALFSKDKINHANHLL